jgi:tryptophanase
MLVIPNHPITKANYKMKERGVKIRYITEITKENVHYCKELMTFAKVRHLDEIRGNFGILDGKYYRASANKIIISTTISYFKYGKGLCGTTAVFL